MTGDGMTKDGLADDGMTNTGVSGDPALRRPLTQAEILRGLKDILARIAGADPDTISLDALIIEDVGVDSLGFYEILIEADETMGIKIEEKDLLTFKTVRDIVTYIEQRENPS
ncbi:acyl carrier protein [Cyanobium sp. NIES-981]|uniref:acyl carrier protein n=1 Tax=Cyanobium sp. NIES-981 TaxID=1851505 RepID=UPI0007DDE0CC|nr:acyl carrier protein [Cyanobium sp. NIES-981]SBO44584.1 Acyl carrier protein (modular protein) [Cyanobium sp. NIES-981]